MDCPPTGTYARRRFNYDELLQQAMGLGYDIHLKRHDRAITDKGIWQGEKSLTEPPPPGFPPGYPAYEVITVNGITDIIEHRKMEPIFYVTDDPAVWKELGVGQK